ncbi:uncharacterized protein YALI1_B06546g [Yarrowia lipolytica]|uniref:Uncharacterized protein n=1 Tax=Yarrowia lipolytica TaxID=4952 RepID=A0A1D8N6I3_YARLL|nr:hypothetical protein YALI1_B06546g [Yarrowia lipolytica]
MPVQISVVGGNFGDAKSNHVIAPPSHLPIELIRFIPSKIERGYVRESSRHTPGRSFGFCLPPRDMTS